MDADKAENRGTDSLYTIKEGIRQSIEHKGVSIPPDTPFNKYPDKIEMIENEVIIGGSVKAEDSAGLFYQSSGTVWDTYADVPVNWK